MGIEKTFIMLKPDCAKRGLVGEILNRIERKGYRIIDVKMQRLDPHFLYEHYAHISDKPFFLDVFNYMLSSPVIGICVSGEDAVAGMRRLVGATRLEDALPGTIRGDFASSTSNNLIHSADSVEAAQEEIRRFFGDEAVSQ